MAGGTLNSNIVHAFKVQFEENCVALLLDSYQKTLAMKGIKEFSENNITLQLVSHMKQNPVRNQLQISIQRESYFDEGAMVNENTEADESPRIDIKYSVWNTNVEYEYYIEAKNLSENDWVKASGSKVNAKKQIRRYIETGIKNFVTGRYPQGCLIGYVLEGDSDKVVVKINEMLTSLSRSVECLLKERKYGFEHHYYSTHTGSSMQSLRHFLLKFN